MPIVDPDTLTYKFTSAIIFGASLVGRWYCAKVGIPRITYTASAVMVPCLYAAAVFQKEKRTISDTRERKTFEENLDFYPVTRRAWNRAVTIRKAELGLTEDDKV